MFVILSEKKKSANWLKQKPSDVLLGRLKCA